MGKKSKASEKKKGPKGKRARAKAKLERQWGEETNDEEVNRSKRVGRSRILARVEKQKIVEESDSEEDNPAVDALLPRKERKNGLDDDDSDSDEEEQEEEMDLANGRAFSTLLQTIRKEKTPGEDSDGEDLMDVDQANVERAMIQDDSSDEESDNDGEVDTNENTAFDPFGLRFSLDPLSQEDGKRNEMLQKLQKTKKVAVPHVHPMLELQISKPLLTDTNIDGEDMSKDSWKQLGKESFACNREILKRSWKEVNKRTLTPWQGVLYPFVSRYADCLIACSSPKKREQVAHMASLHIVNHVLTSRGRIQRQNRRIKALEQRNKDDQEEDLEEPVVKDQGYTRPTVLVLLPTRGACHQLLHQLLELLGGGDVPEEYMKRFDDEYGAPPGGDEGEGTLRRRRKKVLEEKGAQWQVLFGDDVNDDDDFKIGVALNAKAAAVADANKKSNNKSGSAGVSVKLYTDFYSSDIIFASPLGLRMAISSDSNEGDCDFLSSIEVCLMDRSDVMMMQNWDHVNEVLEHLNQLPSSNNETDFARVRDYFLVNQAAHWRQLILLADMADPAILSSFKRFAKSRSGVLKTRQRVSEDEGSISNIIVPVRQVFQRIPVQSIATMNDDRLKYLVQKVLPSIMQNIQKRTLIYIPSYFDYVLVRNHLIKNGAESQFVSVTEYSRLSETSRGRARFLQGRKPLMLYTGRAHFFLRHKIKGARNLIFFGLPEHPEFYSDLVNVINEGLEDGIRADSNDDATTSCTALFTKYEAHSLERIVGTSQSSRMIKGEKTTFMFVS